MYQLMNQLNLLILNKKIEEFFETNDIEKFCDWVNKNVDDNYLDSPKLEKDEIGKKGS
jgi:hypothetical protein|tara:strand:- start:247 stop:420 length:174 start_codon:yes stop_codon:yes gene_type:complete